jgi:8-oxo-dGTP diphosphatase
MGRVVDIHKAGGIIIRDRKLLLERSKGKSIFINPGGKVEPGETVTEALVRELMEEFRIKVRQEDLEVFGTFYAPAAGQEHRLAPDGSVYGQAVGG